MIWIDREGRILRWSDAAARLLGFNAEATVGQRVFEILDARDAFGNRPCPRGCGLLSMAQRGEPVQTFALEVRNADGLRQRLFVNLTAEAVRRAGAERFRIDLRPDLRRLGDRRRVDRRRPALAPARLSVADGQLALGQSSSALGLSPREEQVLRCLADGARTQEVAARLGISPTTVRNHVQKLLHKLDVHSRFEALNVALRHGLL